MDNDDTINMRGPGKREALGPEGLTSAELVELARAGDRQAQERLLERYLPPLRRWATGRLPRWARDLLDTDDMIQETIMKTLRNVASFTPRHEGAFAAYLRQALLNRIRDEIRNAARRPRREVISDGHPDAGDSPLEAAIGAEATSRYEEALKHLSEEERALVVARIELGLSYEEVARETGKPSPDAARMGVRRALVRLAEEMGHD
jgi:RNA polymerase sigma-70 factor (ECF subfamily)